MAAEDLGQNAPHAVIVRMYFEEALKLSRAGVFQLKTTANAIGIEPDEKSVNLAGWLDFCHAHQIKRRFRIIERDLTGIFDTCVANKQGSSESLNRERFQQCLILLCSKIGIRAPTVQQSAGQDRVSHGNAFDSLVGVIVLLEHQLATPPEPWKPMLSLVPKMKTLFKKVAKNEKDPIGALGKSAYLVSNREFVAFYEEENLNQKYSAKLSNAKLLHIFKKSQITDSSASQCDLKEFSYAIMLLAIELGILPAEAVEYYEDTPEGVISIFDQCDVDTARILNGFVLELLNDAPRSFETAGQHNRLKKDRARNVSLLGESRTEVDQPQLALEKVTESVEPSSGTLSSKRIREIISKGYIYRRSSTEAYIADADIQASGCKITHVDGEKFMIADIGFNPILDLQEDSAIELVDKVDDHQKKDIIQHIRRNAYKRQLAIQIQGLDQSTPQNSVASILDYIVDRATSISDNEYVRKNLAVSLEKRWNIGQRGTICKVGVNQLSNAIVQDLVSGAIEISTRNQQLKNELKQKTEHQNGLIWNRTSPGWRYFRAMHVYQELYEDQTIPQIEALNDLHQTTKEFYRSHIEHIVDSHKNNSTKKNHESLRSNFQILEEQTSILAEDFEPDHIQSDAVDLGLDVSWRLRRKIRQDCETPIRKIEPIDIQVDSDTFNLQLSPHLVGALKKSGKQQKDEKYLFAIKQQAKAINDSVVANYSVPSPTLLKRQQNLALQELHEKHAAEQKLLTLRQALQQKQAADSSKTNRQESAMKQMEENAKIDHTIQEGKRVAEISKQQMEQKRVEIIEEKVAVIRNAFESDSRAGRKIVNGFSGKMQRLPSSMEQMEQTISLYTSSNAISPLRSPNSKSFLSTSASPNSRPSTSNSQRSSMHPALWASVISARSSPESSRPSTSHSLQSPNSKIAHSSATLTMSPIQTMSASITKSKSGSPSADQVPLFPGLRAASFFK